jgi:selenocysteine lyase/cysteine desulfurase
VGVAFSTETGASEMALDRRELLKWTALAAFAPLAPPLAAEEQTPASSTPSDWDSVRRQFRLAPDRIHMSAMLFASHPETVRRAIDHHRAGLDADPVAYLELHNDDFLERSRAAAGEYLGLDSSHIALTNSTTMSVGLVYGGLLLKPGDEILTTNEDYYVTYESTRLAAHKAGATVRRIPLFENIGQVTVDGLVNTIVGAVGPRTRVVALTWVHSSTGLKLPLAAIGARLAELNKTRPPERPVLLAVDGVHAFGVENFSFAELGCDFLMAGCHKWLFGPRGTGIIAASRRGLDNIDAVIPSFVSERSFGAWIKGHEPQGAIDADTINPGGFNSFEHLWSLPEAFAFHRGIGKAEITQRTHELASRLKAGLATIEGVTLVTPRDPALSAGIVAFDVEGANPHAVVRWLRQLRVVASVAPYASQHVRLTPSILNTPAEVDSAIAAVARLVS